MAVTYETVTVAGQNVTLSLLLWRRFREPKEGLLEVALAANQTLAARGPVLPIGTVVQIPVPEPENAQTTADPIRLW